MADKTTMIVQNISTDDIRNRIYTIRGVQVMLDSDLAALYGVETRVLNQAVKRNENRFPEDFCFQITSEEFKILKSQLVISSESSWGGTRKLPLVFTEHGVTMLASVLRSDVAVKMGIRIIKEFVAIRHFLVDNALFLQRLRDIDLKLIEHDEKFTEVFKQLEAPRERKASIFSAGQLYDAASFIEDIVSQAKKNITIIDKYVDKHTLDLLVKKTKDVSVLIVTDKNCAELSEQEIELFNKQYGKLEVKYYKKCHARYIIIDGKILYHCGASLKDAGKQIFSIDIIDEPDVLKLLKETVSNIK